jgi:hypothetical protein
MSVDLNKRYYMEVVSVPAHVLEGRSLGVGERLRGVAGRLPGVSSGLSTVEFIRVQQPGQQGYDWYQYQTYDNGQPHTLQKIATPALDEKNIRVLSSGEVNPGVVDYTDHPSEHPLLRAWKANRQTFDPRHVNLAAEHGLIPLSQDIAGRPDLTEKIGNAMWLAMSAEETKLAKLARSEARSSASQNLADVSTRAELQAQQQMQGVGKFVGGLTSLAAGVGLLEVANRFAEPVIELAVKNKEQVGAIGKIVNLTTRVLQGLMVLTYGLSTLSKILGEDTSLRAIAEGGLKGVNRVALQASENFSQAKDFVVGKAKGAVDNADKAIGTLTNSAQELSARKAFMSAMDSDSVGVKLT